MQSTTSDWLTDCGSIPLPRGSPHTADAVLLSVFKADWMTTSSELLRCDAQHFMAHANSRRRMRPVPPTGTLIAQMCCHCCVAATFGRVDCTLWLVNAVFISLLFLDLILFSVFVLPDLLREAWHRSYWTVELADCFVAALQLHCCHHANYIHT